MNDRRGRPKKRGEYGTQRKVKLGHYIIITDTEATEKNYFLGLQQALPDGIRDQITIQCCKFLTKELVEKAIQEKNTSAQYAKIWIIVDRDRVPNFDALVEEANASNIEVGWSNPCIEIWFFAYFGEMRVENESKNCCRDFRQEFKKRTNQEYQKSDNDIYKKLVKYGDERTAITTAQKRYKEQKEMCRKPTKMLSTSTVFRLVDEITSFK